MKTTTIAAPPIGRLVYQVLDDSITLEFGSRRAIWELLMGVFKLWRNTFLPKTFWDVVHLLWFFFFGGFAIHSIWRLDVTGSQHDFHNAVIWLLLLIWNERGKRRG